MKIKSLLCILFTLVFVMACSHEHPDLIQAVIKKDYVTMEILLSKGADPNEHSYKVPSGHAAYSDHHTALSLAAAGGDKRAVLLLLKYKADRHEKTRKGATPFDWALEYDHLDIAKLLWESSPHTGYISHGTGAMVKYLYEGNYDTYHYFRSQLKGDKYIQNVFLKILHNVSGLNNSGQIKAKKILSYLISQGEKPGNETLFFAVYTYSNDIINLLLKAGVNPNGLVDTSVIDLDLIGFTGSNRKFFDRDHGNTALMKMLESPGGFDIAKSLLSKGGDINTLNSKGRNGLMHYIATTFYQSNYRKKFKDVKPEDIPASDDYKYTQTKIIKFYIENGSRLDLKDNDGKSVLDLINPDDHDYYRKREYILSSIKNKI